MSSPTENPAPPEPRSTPGRLPRAPFLAGTAVVLTLLSLGVMAASNRMYSHHISQMLTLSDARFQVAEAHVLLEEITAGDPEETDLQMSYHLDIAVDALAALRDGGDGHIHQVPPLAADAAAALTAAVTHLDDVRAIATRRLGSQHAAAGSELDRKLDRSYLALLAELDRVENQLSGAAAARARNFRLLTILLLAGIILSGGGAVGVSVRDRRRLELDAQSAHAYARQNSLAEMTLLAATVDQAAEIILITDREARILYVNHAFTQLVGFTQKELYQQYAEVLRSPQHEPAFYEDLFRQLTAGIPWRGTLFYRRKDGTDLETEAAITPIRDQGGEVTHHVSVARDVTREKAMQAQMEHMQRLESLGVLAGGIAHDFNNILTSIMGSAGLARLHAEDDPQMDDYLERIETSTERAADLCRQMLSYSGRGTLQTGPVDLSVAVSELGRLMEATVPKHIKVVLNLQPKLPPVAADRGQLSQVIMNLLINAQEAIGDAPGTIRVSTGVTHAGPDTLARAAVGADSPPGDYVMLEVADTGCGMDAETRKRIFDPFFTTKFTGRGLGMSALMGIVRAHRGMVLVTSQPRHGTTFRILLPPSALSPIPPAPERPTSRWKCSGTALIVDDEEPVRRVAEAMLGRIGFSTLSACDGIEGLQMLEERNRDIVCVLLDLTMPRMSGAQVLDVIRTQSPALPVVLTSGYNATDADTLIRDDKVKFLQKPFSSADLESTLRDLLETDA